MIPGVIARLRSFWRGLRRRSDVETEMDEEFRVHVELRAEDLARSGVTAAEAARQARREFGSTARYADEARVSRGLHRIDAVRFSWLDFKLGLRMLVKYPGLTLVGGVAMAVAIAIGAGYTSLLKTFLEPEIPLPEGDRLVALQNWDPRVSNKNTRLLHDFVMWREELESVRDVGAYRTVTRNLIGPDGASQPLAIAEMSAAGFRAAGVQPLLGRFLLDEDERAGAPGVVVIGYDVWRGRFSADPGILGREFRLGTATHTVVGVMPEGFAFPINHRFWIPFRANQVDYERGAGPSISVFGRLAPGIGLAQARAEMAVIGRRMAAAYPETHEHLRAQVQPYTYAFSDMDDPGNVLAMRAFQFLVSLLLVVICINVAALIYARTAVRGGEIVVRAALGASRARVVVQLFAESLVLSSAAAVLGLGLVAVAFRAMADQAGSYLFVGQLPFWMDFGLSFGSVVHAAALAVLAAVITGVLPALKATGRRLQTSLQRLSAGGWEMLLGRTWTFLIVGQVAFAVALLPTAGYVSAQFIRHGTVDPGFAAEDYVSSLVYMERDWEDEERTAEYHAEFEERYGQRIAELMRRLRAEYDVADVTFGTTVPGSEWPASIEVERASRPGAAGVALQSEPTGHGVQQDRVDIHYFDVFDVPVIAGRNFTTADAGVDATAVIVNQSFARRFFGEGNAIGRRVRYAGGETDATRTDRQNPWLEIVGVVPDFPNRVIEPGQLRETMYRAAALGQIYPVRLAVRARGVGPAAVAAQVRRVMAALDPTLQLRGERTLDAVYEGEQRFMRRAGLAIAVVVLSVLLLSAAGIYAMMSLAVARRRREIGIRAALGAGPRRLLAIVFARAAMQLGLGTGVGLAAALAFDSAMRSEPLFHQGPVFIPIVAVIVLAVGLLASIGPARRGLRIQPTEALRQE